MSSWRSTGITMMILLVVVLLVAISVASVITEETTSATTDYNIDEITDEIFNELTSYIQIKDQKGRFSEINGEKRIEKIALLISPMVSQEIDLSQLTIQIDNGDEVRILTYNNSEKIDSKSLFEHDLWDSLNGENYGLISIVDLDDSIVDYNALTENSDNAYLVFKLPSSMTMKKYDKIFVTLFPSSGITRTTILKAPMPMSSVITFE